MNIKLVNRSTTFLALLCLLSVVLGGCVPIPAPVVPADALAAAPTAVPATGGGAYWPTNGWRTSTPEEQGMDSQKLAAMLAEIKERKIDVHSLLVVRNGYLVCETYLDSYQQDLKQDMQSVGRSFTSALIGITIDKGYIDGVEQRIIDFFPERTFANLDKQKEAMTLDDVLTMRSGSEPQPGDPYYQAMQNSRDWLQFLLDMPDRSPRKPVELLCGVLTYINRHPSGNSSHKSSRLCGAIPVKPLGISAGRWMTNPAGIPYGAGDLISRTTWPSWDTSISGRAGGMGRHSPPSGWRTPRGPTRT